MAWLLISQRPDHTHARPHQQCWNGQAGFKDKMKSQEVKQSLSEKKNAEECKKKAKGEDLLFFFFYWLDILNMNLVSMMKAITGRQRRGNFKEHFERISWVYTVLQFKEIKSLCN